MELFSPSCLSPQRTHLGSCYILCYPFLPSSSSFFRSRSFHRNFHTNHRNPLCRQLKKLEAARAYLEKQNPLFEFFNKVQGSLPVVGLLTRLLSDEGGIGNDRLQFAEFSTRVRKNCSPEASRAFYDFAERHGKVAKPPFVLIWCWTAALGAGLLKSDDILMSASRLRVSYDIQYEVDNINVLMDAAAEKRATSNSSLPFVPMEARAEKALEAICKCCIGRTVIDEDDANILSIILFTVFPSADRVELERLVKSRVSAPAINISTEESDPGNETEKVQDHQSVEGVEKTEIFVQ